MTMSEALKELKHIEDTDIYEYGNENDKNNYISWLKNIGAWDQLTLEARKEIAS